MDFGAVAKSVWDQFVTVWHTPVPFFAALLASWFAMRWFIRGQYETRLANADSTIAMLEKKLDRQETSEAISIAATQVAHETAPRSQAQDRPKGEELRRLSDAEVTNATPKQIMSLLVGRTLIQAKPLVDQYTGKAMTVTGSLKDVIELSTASVLLTMMTDGFLVFCYFQNSSQRLLSVKTGETITVRGLLEGISNLGFDLAECEFA